MILFPAIDLKDGACVRLKEGRMEEATVFDRDPLRQARALKEAGFSCLHLVDLNAATGEGGDNGDVIARIVSEIGLAVQLGGGVRRREHIEAWLERGCARIVLGTALMEAPAMARRACADFPGRIVFALDAKGGRLATRGWKRFHDLSLLEAAGRFASWKPAAFLHTEIARDGLMTGLDVRAAEALAEASSVPVIASGGLSDLADLERLARSPHAEAGRIEGVIAGRALYDGRLPAAEALLVAGGSLSAPLSARC